MEEKVTIHPPNNFIRYKLQQKKRRNSDTNILAGRVGDSDAIWNLW